MLFGEFHHQLDEKNRMRLPAKLKAKLGSGYVITKGSNGCLFVFSKEEIEKTIYEKLKSLPISDIKAQKSVRSLFSSGYEVEEDNQGRFLLPTYLKDFALISKNVVTIGVGNRVEIWDEDRWNEYNGCGEGFDEILAGLSQYGI